MSFSHEVIDELLNVETAKTCCRKAMLFGLFYGARILEDSKNTVVSEFRTLGAADCASRILQKQFSTVAEPVPVTRAGRRLYVVKASSKVLTGFVRAIDSVNGLPDVKELVGYRCPECPHSFLRGVFIACGTVNDPHKGYHLEFSVPDFERAAIIAHICGLIVPNPRTIDRVTRVGVYYKTNEAIFDLLNYIGGGNSSFVITNAFIERDIRNAENRATNCVARNISKSVEASIKQIEAIRILRESGRFLSLPAELRYTADLRLENPSASLFELAHLHDPPISKSGLNRRLVKLLEEAEGDTEKNNI